MERAKNARGSGPALAGAEAPKLQQTLQFKFSASALDGASDKWKTEEQMMERSHVETLCNRMGVLLLQSASTTLFGEGGLLGCRSLLQFRDDREDGDVLREKW
jgi:hypothetical protein